MEELDVFEKFEKGEISFEQMREICGGKIYLDEKNISPVAMI